MPASSDEKNYKRGRLKNMFPNKHVVNVNRSKLIKNEATNIKAYKIEV
jgi:hypothetical protein